MCPTFLVDSGASVSVVSAAITNLLSSLSFFNNQVATAGQEGQSLSITAKGSLGKLDNVLISPDIRHNCLSLVKKIENFREK